MSLSLLIKFVIGLGNHIQLCLVYSCPCAQGFVLAMHSGPGVSTQCDSGMKLGLAVCKVSTLTYVLSLYNINQSIH